MTVIDTVNHAGKTGEIYETEDGKLFCRGMLSHDFQVCQYWLDTHEEITYLYQSGKTLDYYPLLRAGLLNFLFEHLPVAFFVDKEDVPF